GQLAGAAAEVDESRAFDRLEEAEQVEERLAALVAEPGVLVGVPGVGPGRLTHRAVSCGVYSALHSSSREVPIRHTSMQVARATAARDVLRGCRGGELDRRGGGAAHNAAGDHAPAPGARAGARRGAADAHAARGRADAGRPLGAGTRARGVGGGAGVPRRGRRGGGGRLTAAAGRGRDDGGAVPATAG